MNIRIHIIEDGRTIDWNNLTQEEKKEVSERLNRQALYALGYVEKDMPYESNIS
ncbi:MAG: hypothetical protein PUB17_09560 [Lachnospiraceae bacterium]|nr:hypothetical protein [Lachnospiraceae bacterium]